MLSSAEISVVETFGSPNRLKRSSVTSRMRSAVRRGAFLAMLALGDQCRLQCMGQVIHHFLQRGDGAADTGGRLARRNEVAPRVVENVRVQGDAVSPQLG